MKNHINIYNNLIKLTRDKKLYLNAGSTETFSLRLIFFLIHFALFLRNYKKDNSKKMASDIDEMEKMLNDYLQYAKSQSEEDYTEIDVNELVLDILGNYDSSKFELKVDEKIKIYGRKNLLRRSLSNIVENGLSYGDKIFVEIKKSVGNAIIMIQDNGPGLPKKEYDNVFKPFYRVDKSRSLNKSGVGLGLSISQDIVKSHGGNIILEKSKMNGLRVKVFLPV